MFAPRVFIFSAGMVIVALAGAVTPARAATNITSCGVLDTAGETYVLQNDVSSEGTCFAIGDHHITLDLNGHTVTYNTVAGDRQYGVAIPVGYYNSTSQSWFPGLPASAFGSADYVTIKNGAINQGGGNGSNAHAIYGRESTNSTVTGITSTVQGNDAGNILFVQAPGTTIANNTLVSNVTVVTDRHLAHGMVAIRAGSGNCSVYANTLTGGPQMGIIVEGTNVSGDVIYGNTISQNARVANPYAIAAWSSNSKIYNNVINVQNGRGIHLKRDNVEVYANTVTVKEGANPENPHGWTHGIKVEGATNSRVHDNIVTAFADPAFGDAYPLDITVFAGSNNSVYNNVFSATTTDANYIAAAVHLGGVSAGSGLDIHHNTFRSNNYLVYADWDAARDVLFRSNTFERVGTPIKYAFLRFNTGTNPSLDLYFRDSVLNTGIQIDDVSYRPGGATLSFHVQQYLQVQVRTPQGGALAHAALTVRTAAGTTVATGTADAQGDALFVIQTQSYVGKPPALTDYMPHTVTVSTAGYQSGSYTVTLDSSKTVNFVLAASTGETQVVETPFTAPAASTPPRQIDSRATFFAYSKDLRGGFAVAVGNVLGGSRDDIIAGTGTGMAPHVRVLTSSGQLLSQFFAYHSGLRNGVTVAACDIDGNGYDEIVTAQGRGGWPLVKIFDGSGKVVHNGFFVLDGKFTGGVNVACGDIDGDGISEIVVAAMRGGGPQVMVYRGTGKLMSNFMAYAPSFRGGINVTTADVDGNGTDEIITGPQWGAPHVQIFKVQKGSVKRLSPGFFAFNRNYRGGVSVAGVDTDGDGKKEIAVGVGDNATPFVKVYTSKEQWRDEFFVYPANFLGGVQLAGGDVDGDGREELITIPRGRGAPQIRVIDVD